MEILNWLAQNGRDVGTGVIIAVIIMDKIISPLIKWLQSGNDNTKTAIEAHSKEAEADTQVINSLIAYIGKLTDNLSALTELNRNQLEVLEQIRGTTIATHSEVQRLPEMVMLRLNAALLDRITTMEREMANYRKEQTKMNQGIKQAFIKTNENLGKLAKLITHSGG
jgi:hypothetical protein